MAKRKNPLKDLDSFLKQEAASFVKPDQVTPSEEHSVEAVDKKTTKDTDSDDVIAYFKDLYTTNPASFRATLHHVIQKSQIHKHDPTVCVIFCMLSPGNLTPLA